MEARLQYSKISPGIYKAMLGLENHTNESGLERTLLDLVRLRASQLNGCAFCLDMHWKDLRAAGESEQLLNDERHALHLLLDDAHAVSDLGRCQPARRNEVRPS